MTKTFCDKCGQAMRQVLVDDDCGSIHEYNYIKFSHTSDKGHRYEGNTYELCNTCNVKLKSWLDTGGNK